MDWCVDNNLGKTKLDCSPATSFLQLSHLSPHMSKD